MSKVTILLVLTLISSSIQNVEEQGYLGNSTNNEEDTGEQEDSPLGGSLYKAIPCTGQENNGKSPYLAQIFNKYGEQGKIDLEGFEKLFNHLNVNHNVMSRLFKNQDEKIRNVRTLNEDLSKSSNFDKDGVRDDPIQSNSNKEPMQSSNQAGNQKSTVRLAEKKDTDEGTTSPNDRHPRNIPQKKRRHLHGKPMDGKRKRYKKHSHTTEKQIKGRLDRPFNDKYWYSMPQIEGLSSKNSHHESDVNSFENGEKISRNQDTGHSKIPLRHKKHSNRSKISSTYHPFRLKRQASEPADENSGRGTELNEKQCLSPASFLRAQNLTRESNLTSSDFLKLCPALLYLIDKRSCLKAPPCVADTQHDLLNMDGIYGDSHESDGHLHEHHNQSENHNDTDHGDHDNHGHETTPKKTWKNWLYAILFVCVISLLSVLGIFIVPCSQRKWYPYVQHLMLGMAVGSLVGDSLLHLLPMALNRQTLYGATSHDSHDGADNHSYDGADNHSHDDPDNHSHNPIDVWKGFVIFLGVYMFYLLERSMEFFTKKKSDTNLQKRDALCVKALNCAEKERTGESKSTVNQSTPGMSQTATLLSNQSKQDPQELDVLSSKGTNVDINPKQQPSAKMASDGEYESSSVRELVSPTKKESLKGINMFNHSEELIEEKPSDRCDSEERKKSVSLNDLSLDKKHKKSSSLFKPFSITKIEKQGNRIQLTKESSRPGHYFTARSSSFSKPVISSAAWIVIFGDAFHNFCDGLAIGSTFAGSTKAGLSTGLAVFMHELPHELGDFAMLLRSGMGIKKALFYNFLSSLTCLVGTIIGLALGSTEEVLDYLVPAVAGIFIYIALVDMLPELTIRSSHDRGRPCILFLSQNLGISLGTTMMLLIALYEDDIDVT